MKKFDTQVAQGDVVITAIDKIPSGISTTIVEPTVDGKHIVTHSETGHHHTVPASNVIMMAVNGNPFLLYMKVENEPVALTHMREFDQHEAYELPPGMYQVNRQREFDPMAGIRRALD